MDWTDRHCRYFHRLLTGHARLYSEMVTADAVIHGDRARLLAFSPEEHPVALQLGGSDPVKLGEAAAIGEAEGYDEINLNVGCPSDRVQAACFGAAFMVFSHRAGATQADDTTIRITGHTAGVTPFINRVTLAVSNTSVLKSIQFTVIPKPGSVTRPLSGTYANSYLVDRGFENPQTGEIILPIYGLYDGYNNTVRLTYRFLDGSSKRGVTSVTTATFDDPCGYKNPTILKPRTSNTDLSYDYMMVKDSGGSCSIFSPSIIDTDGALRWVGTAGVHGLSAIFFDNAVYLGHRSQLSRIDLDGTVTLVGDYSGIGIVNLHHNIDRGKVGIILDVDTTTYFESTLIEVGVSGRVLKTWNMANIIRAAMIAGGDDPSQFVYPAPNDWFHNNSVAYNRADDSLIVSSRENFLICLDYDTGLIKWILGDPTKSGTNSRL